MSCVRLEPGSAIRLTIRRLIALGRVVKRAQCDYCALVTTWWISGRREGQGPYSNEAELRYAKSD